MIFRGLYLFLLVEPTSWHLEDQGMYLASAELINSGGSVFFPERTPGYPLLINGVQLILGTNEYNFIVFQCILDSLTCVIISRTTYKLLGEGKLIAGLLSAANLNLIVFSSMFLTDTVFTFLFVCFLSATVKFFKHADIKHLIVAALCLSLSATIRSASYYLIPGALGFLLIYLFYRAKFKFKRLVLGTFGSLVPCIFLLGPLHLNNWDRYQTVDLVSQTGTALLNWVLPGTVQYSGIGSYQEGKHLASQKLADRMRSDNLTELPSNPFLASEYQSEVAIQAIKELGVVSIARAWFVGSILNIAAPSIMSAPFFRAMNTQSFYYTEGAGVVDKMLNFLSVNSLTFNLLFLIGTLISGALAALSLTGFLLLLQSKSFDLRIAVYFLTVMGLYFLLITGPIIGSKYRLPIEPIMTMFAVYAIVRVQHKHKRC